MKKTVYLGNNTKMFKYRTPKELQEEAKRYGISIGYEVTVGDYVGISNNVTIGDDAVIGSNAKVGYGATIGDNATIRNGARIGDYSTIGNAVRIGSRSRIGDYCTIDDGAKIRHWCTIGKNVTIADNLTILTRAKIKDGWKIENIVHLRNEYRYHVSGYIVDGTIIIQLGCYTRTLTEWENDFWNNNEFKKGTPEGEQRLRAFEKIKKIMEK